MAIERTFIALKPDAVQRGLIGEIISRFEKVGMKVVGGKFVWIDSKLGEKHYFDLAERRGKKVLDVMLKFMTQGPVFALCHKFQHNIKNFMTQRKNRTL